MEQIRCSIGKAGCCGRNTEERYERIVTEQGVPLLKPSVKSYCQTVQKSRIEAGNEHLIAKNKFFKSGHCKYDQAFIQAFTLLNNAVE